MANAINQGQNNLTQDDIMAQVRARIAAANVIVPAPNTYDGYADGGVNDYTGWAKVHGTKTSAETFFNATDSKKLYDLIHNSSTPDLRNMIVKPNISGINSSQAQSMVFRFEATFNGNADQSVKTQLETMQKKWSEDIYKTLNKHVNGGGRTNLFNKI
jgi:hypothetical protein